MRLWIRRAFRGFLWTLALFLILLFELAIRSLDDGLVRHEDGIRQHEQRLDDIEDLLRGDRLWHWEWMPSPPDEVWT